MGLNTHGEYNVLLVGKAFTWDFGDYRIFEQPMLMRVYTFAQTQSVDIHVDEDSDQSLYIDMSA